MTTGLVTLHLCWSLGLQGGDEPPAPRDGSATASLDATHTEVRESRAPRVEVDLPTLAELGLPPLPSVTSPYPETTGDQGDPARLSRLPPAVARWSMLVPTDGARTLSADVSELRDPFEQRAELSWARGEGVDFDGALLRDLLDPFAVSPAGANFSESSSREWLLFDDLKDPFEHQVGSERLRARWSETLRDPFTASMPLLERAGACEAAAAGASCRPLRMPELQDPFNSQ